MQLDADEKHVGFIATFDFVTDREPWRYVPNGVALHITRTREVPFENGLDVSRRVAARDSVQPAVQTLTYVTDTMAYACTSGSFIDGADGESRLRDSMLEAGARQVTTTSGAIVAACEHLGVSRVGVVTPYDDVVTERLVRFLDERGIEVAASAHLSLLTGMSRIPADLLRRLAREVDRSDADALIISCTGIPTYDLVVELEASLGKPVITAIQATMWALLRLADVHPDVPHRLFRPI
jgi:maleate isomerase